MASSIYSDGNFAKKNIYIEIHIKYKLLCVGSSGWMAGDAKQHKTEQKTTKNNVFVESIKKENYPFF